MLPAIEEATGSFREVSVKLEDILSKLIRQGLAQSVQVCFEISDGDPHGGLFGEFTQE